MVVANVSVVTSASPAAIWKLYEDHTTWPKWDCNVEYVYLNGEFRQGATGVLKPKCAPKAKFTISEFIQQRLFTSVSFLPFTKIIFSHALESIGDGKTKVTHRMEMTGFLAPLFTFFIGRKVKAGLPTAMHKLVKLAELNS